MTDTLRAVEVAEKAGYPIHVEISIMLPSQQIGFHDFTVDSLEVKAYLPVGKQDKLRTSVSNFPEHPNTSIEQLDQVTGLLLS